MSALGLAPDGRAATAVSDSVYLGDGAGYHGCEQSMNCRSSAGYSLDAGKNMQVLSDEVDSIFAKESAGAMSSASISRVNALLELSRVWCWIDRVESMHDDSINLTDCGVLSMFEEHMSHDEKTTHAVHPVLGIKTFSSSSRSSARTVCGWTDTWTPNPSTGKLRKDDFDGASAYSNSDAETMASFSELEGIIEECEDLDSFERAAAIALWHGNIELAVNVLRRNIDAGVLNPAISKSDAAAAEETAERAPMGWNADMTTEYLQLVSLVAMCFAGYSAELKKSTRNAWTSMCLHVLAQLEGSKRQATSYLVAACRFLFDTLDNSNDGFDAIIMNDKLYLEDRIAFSCIYLSDGKVVAWLSDVTSRCKESGSCEGLLVTGLSGDGLDILQQYIDIYTDIQTAALLVGRKVEKVPENTSPPREWLWLFEYRNLLNRWQMFIERASLDVELGKLQRQRPDRNRSASGLSLLHQQQQDSSIDGSAHGSQTGNNSHLTAQPLPSSATNRSGIYPENAANKPSGGVQVVDRKTSLNRTMYTLPVHSDFPHVYLRCHYCSSSLPVDAMQQQNTAYLRKQRPIINFCPNCKKPLPRCYVCQLYVGLINPHAEVSRILAQKRRIADNSNALQIGLGTTASLPLNLLQASSLLKEEEKSDHNILNFGRWLFFCQRCKHGGHASCIDDWFGQPGVNDFFRSVCGVSGCNCRCLQI